MITTSSGHQGGFTHSRCRCISSSRRCEIFKVVTKRVTREQWTIMWCEAWGWVTIHNQQRIGTHIAKSVKTYRNFCRRYTALAHFENRKIYPLSPQNVISVLISCEKWCASCVVYLCVCVVEANDMRVTCNTAVNPEEKRTWTCSALLLLFDAVAYLRNISSQHILRTYTKW